LGHEVQENVLGESWDFTLNCEENSFGGIWFSDFFGVWAGIHVSLLRRGDS
jgi:hypothetical protein